MKRSPPRSRATRKRTLPSTRMVWIAFLCFFSHLSSLAHLSLVQHKLCAEHGDWVHASSHDAAKNSDSRADGTEGSGDEDTGSDSEKHEHCSILSNPDYSSPSLSIAIHFPEVVSDGAGVVLCSSEEHLSKRIYSFAPKTSPPV